MGAYGLSAEEGLFVNNSDPMLVQMVAYPPFRRMFWRTIQDAVNGPFQPAVIGAVAEANYAFLTQHYSVSTPQAASLLSPDGGKTNVPALRQWITNRYSFLTGQLATVAAPFEISNNGGNNFAVTQQTGITLAGKAPVEAAFLRVNGAGTNANVTWTSVTNWSLGAELPLGTNTLTVEGFDRLNQALGGFSDTITITNKP